MWCWLAGRTPDDLVFTAPRGGSIREHKLQRQLGHKDAVQTLNCYGHLYPDELDSLAERLEQVGSGPARRLGRPRCGPTVSPWSSG